MSAETPVDRLGSFLTDAAVTVVLVTDQGGAKAAELMGHDTKAGCRKFLVLDVRALGAVPAGGDLAASSDGEDVSLASREMPEAEEREEGEEEEEEEEETDAYSAAAMTDRDAYIYYTSGSSGQPKGVSSGHAPMINRLRWMCQRWPFGEDEVCCQRVDHVFIDFVAEMFGPLSCGLSILIVPCAVRKNPVLLKDFITDNGITRITLVPTLTRLVIDAALCNHVGLRKSQDGPSSSTTEFAVFKSVRLWVLSGEALPMGVARGLAQLSMPASTLLNLYGSTEVAADITFHSWNCGNIVRMGDNSVSDPPEGGVKDGRLEMPSVPIGQPILNCGAELMETSEEFEQGGGGGTRNGSPPKVLHRINPTEQGRVGMLYVCGAGLARGYWERHAATNNCFPSYTWDPASSCYRLCSSSTPEPVPSQTKTLATHALGDRSTHGGGGSDGDGRAIRFFRTGDLASYEEYCNGGGNGNDSEEWNLVYRGRLDQQIKINGQRFDLAEVEACLVRVGTVVNGAAVALTGNDLGRGEYGGRQEGSDLASGDLVGAVVSPENVDTAIVLAECRQHLPSFAVPQLIVVASAVPTLPSSGKVDRREVRRMVLAHSHRQSSRTGGADHSGTMHREKSNNLNGDVEKVAGIIAKAVVCTLQSSGDRDTLSRGTEISENADLFAEVGLSSVQVVHLVHEIRRQLHASGSNVPDVVRLIDLYSHPSIRALAQRLVPFQDTSAERENEGKHDFVADSTGALLATSSNNSRSRDGESDVARDAPDNNRGSGVHFTIRPITADLKTETVTLLSNVFLDSEPLLSSGLERCRALVGGAGATIVRQCYTRLVTRGVEFLLRRGGRVLVATDDVTGEVLGFTVGTELVESAQGSGFFASNNGGTGTVREDSKLTQVVSRNSSRPHTEGTPWQKFTGWLLGLPIRSMMSPVSALIDELLNKYQQEKGWAYAPGEVMYISETGCSPNQRRSCVRETEFAGNLGIVGTGRNTRSTSARNVSGGCGVRGALLAEFLERRLLQEASDAGFIRAVTICTNAVTAHVARELGFKEVARISPVQMYYPPSRQKTVGSCWRRLPRMTRQGLLSPSVGEHSSDMYQAQSGSRPGPFARVPVEHANAVLFEKVLALGVPLDLLLDQRQQESVAQPEDAAASHGNGHSVTTTAGEGAALKPPIASLAVGNFWQLVSVGRGSRGHHREMLEILVNSLPDLASSGRATRYMTDDVQQGQAAFLLLNCPAGVSGGIGSQREEPVTEPATSTVAEKATRQPEAASNSASADGHLDSLTSSPSKWSVVACVSWRRRVNAEEHNLIYPVVGAGKKSGGERTEDVALPPSLSRELLVLAVDRRWRCRGLGAALVAKFLADCREDGESHVFVRSLLASVEFYQRQGFRTMEGVRGSGGQDGECLLVHDRT